MPHGSQSFDILDWGGSLSGVFESIQLPTLGGTLVWDTSQLYTTGVLSVVGPANLAGDYNQNGTVDAADYVVVAQRFRHDLYAGPLQHLACQLRQDGRVGCHCWLAQQ